jgi:hypothetical protein
LGYVISGVYCNKKNQKQEKFKIDKAVFFVHLQGEAKNFEKENLHNQNFLPHHVNIKEEQDKITLVQKIKISKIKNKISVIFRAQISTYKIP